MSVVGSAPGTAGGAPAQLLFRFLRLVAARAHTVPGAIPALRIVAARHARLDRPRRGHEGPVAQRCARAEIDLQHEAIEDAPEPPLPLGVGDALAPPTSSPIGSFSELPQAIIPSSTAVEPTISSESWRRTSAKYFSAPGA